MAHWHLREVKLAIEKLGWRVVSELPGDHYSIAQVWKIQRSPKEPTFFIEIGAMDGDGNLTPLDQAYECAVRDHPKIALYFGKRGLPQSKSRIRWRTELTQFVKDLESIAGKRDRT